MISFKVCVILTDTTAILQLRIYALYLHNGKILAIMLICYVGVSVTSGWVLWNELAGTKGELRFSRINPLIQSLTVIDTAFLIQEGRVCISSPGVPNAYRYHIPFLLFDVILCTLAFVRGLQEYQSHGPLLHRGRSFLKTLVRDSLLYFFL